MSEGAIAREAPAEHTTSVDATRVRKSRVRQVISSALLVAAVSYLLYVLHAQWGAIGVQFSQWTAATWIGALLAALSMMATKSFYHAVQFKRLGQGRRPGTLRIAASFASSQVVRYLPGKVLGIVYQASLLAPDVPAFRVLAANLIQGVYTNLLTISVLGSILAWAVTGSVALGLTLWLCGGIFVALSHGFAAVERATAWLARRLPHRWHRGALPMVHSGWANASLCAALLTLEWIPYFAIWLLLAPATASAAPISAAILLGASYAGASLAANLAVLMPSGLFVREAVFLFVASRLGFDPAMIIVLGAVARILLTLSDLLFAALMAAISAALTKRA